METSELEQAGYQLTNRYLHRLRQAALEVAPELDVDNLLNRAGALPSDENPPPPRSLPLFLSAARVLLDNGCVGGLGLRFGTKLRFSDYGMVGMAIASCSDLEAALRLNDRYLTLMTNTEEFTCDLQLQGQWASINYEQIRGEWWPEPYLIEQEISSCMRLILDLLPDVSASNFRNISLAYPAPSYHKLYGEVLGCPVRFNQPYTSFTFPKAWLSRPLPSSNPLVRQLLEEQCQQIIEGLEQQGSWVENVRRLLLHRPADAWPNLNQAAALFKLPPHTLRRRLYDANTSYKQITNSLKMELALKYLRATNLSIQEIAYQLGYNHAPNLFIAFKKYYRITPQQARDRQQEPSRFS